MMYQSTRDPSHKKYTSAEVIKMGLAPDGGLFLPETIPTLSEADIEALRHESYPVRAARILHMFLTDYTQEELDSLVARSPYYKATANDVDWLEKVRMQGRVQKWVDHSI